MKEKPKIMLFWKDEKNDYSRIYTSEEVIKDLQGRIDKAIEKLNDSFDYTDSDFESMRFQNDIINILKGEEK